METTSLASEFRLEPVSSREEALARAPTKDGAAAIMIGESESRISGSTMAGTFWCGALGASSGAGYFYQAQLTNGVWKLTELRLDFHWD